MIDSKYIFQFHLLIFYISFLSNYKKVNSSAFEITTQNLKLTKLCLSQKTFLLIHLQKK